MEKIGEYNPKLVQHHGRRAPYNFVLNFEVRSDHAILPAGKYFGLANGVIAGDIVEGHLHETGHFKRIRMEYGTFAGGGNDGRHLHVTGHYIKIAQPAQYTHVVDRNSDFFSAFAQRCPHSVFSGLRFPSRQAYLSTMHTRIIRSFNQRKANDAVVFIEQNDHTAGSRRTGVVKQRYHIPYRFGAKAVMRFFAR